MNWINAGPSKTMICSKSFFSRLGQGHKQCYFPQGIDNKFAFLLKNRHAKRVQNNKVIERAGGKND
jgi:hypothetical protein